MIQVSDTPPWLDVALGAEKQVLSWAVQNPGLVLADHVSWREVRDADLGPDLDVDAWLARETANTGRRGHVVMLTSRTLDARISRSVSVGEITATCLATVGLSNGESVAAALPRTRSSWGTINLLVDLDAGLSEPALIEALSIATEARTAALIKAGPAGVTGTGTDCIAVAASVGTIRHSGLHTDVGRAIGGAVHAAVLQATNDWMRDVAMTEGTAHGL